MMRSFGDAAWRMLVRGEGCYVWDVDGKRVPRLPRRDRGQLARSRASGVRRGDERRRSRPSRTSRTTSRPCRSSSSPSGSSASPARATAVASTSATPGAEANEAAFKLARLHRGPTAAHPARSTMRSTAAPWARSPSPASRTMREPFLPMTPGVEHIDSTIEALEAAHRRPRRRARSSSRSRARRA